MTANSERQPPAAVDSYTDTQPMEEGEQMTERAKEARRAYRREWNRKNKDKVKAAQARYWEKKAAAAQDQESAKA